MADDGAVEGDDKEAEEPGEGNEEAGEGIGDAEEVGGSDDKEEKCAGSNGEVAELFDGAHAHSGVETAQLGGEEEDGKVEGHPGEGSDAEPAAHDEITDEGGEGNSPKHAEDIGGEHGEDHDAAGMPGSSAPEGAKTYIQMDELVLTFFHFPPWVEKTL